MKTHTSQFKDAIKSYGRQIDSKITYLSNGDRVELGKEELNSTSLYYEGAILKSVMRQLQVDSNVEIPKGTVISCQFGVKVNGSYEYMNLGNFIVDEIEQQEDKRSYLITCYDKMLYSMVDYEDMGITYPITIRDYLGAIATHLGLTFKNTSDSFANWNKQIANELYLDSEGNSMGYKFRDVLDEIAQATASTICINEEDDELEVRYITNSLDTIDEEFLNEDDVNINEKYGPINSIVLSRAAGADNVYLRDETSVTQNGLCEIKITDNQIMNWNDRATYLTDILVKLDGLEYYTNELKSTGVVYYNLCDRYNVQIGENTYSCVMFNDEINITQGLEENIFTEIPEQAETDYSKADKTDRKINQTYIIVDKQNNTIESVVSSVDEQNDKISQITQTVDELNAKISDVADVTVTGESNEGYLVMENINASEPIGIKIHPIVENISYLYPRSNLYPSNSLYSKVRTIRFTNTSTSEVFDLELPEDLLYYNGSIYDEFLLDYENELFQVTKRCEYNADGTVGILANEETHTYTYSHINLSDGNYTVQLLGYSAAYIYVRLMAANIYTSQFATRVEMTSAINQKANEINLVVAEKLDEDEFTHAEIVAKINDDTSQVKINADQVDIEANDVLNILAGNTINLTSKGINIDSTNFKVTTAGNLTAANANISGAITATSGTFNGTVNATNGNIGGFTLTTNNLYSGSGSTRAGMATPGAGYAFYAGAEDSYSAPFRVDHAGNMVCTNANISGTVNASSGSFTGAVNATSGTFKGRIQAGSGTIGNWSINGSGIYSSNVRIYPDQMGYNYNSAWYSAPWSGVGRAGNAYSDKNLKKDIQTLDEKYEAFFDDLKPVSFKFKEDKDNKDHIGFIAQDIQQSEKNNGLDLDIIYKTELDDYLNLDKRELIALNTWQIQKLKKEIEELKREIKELKESEK